MEENKGPYKKSRSGRFQISLFKTQRFISSRSDFESELPVAQVRACVQYSRYNHSKQDWDRNSIWCSPEELRDLGNALDGLVDYGAE
ncbi:hypothetical protein ACFL6P_00100 [Candidatus Latescibacterota bacterium]